MNRYAAFAQAALERAVKTFAQALAALLLADGTDLLSTNWGDRLSVAGMAAVISVLTSVGSASVGSAGPSLANEATVPPAVTPGHDDPGYGAIELLVAVLVVVILVLLILRLA